MNTLRRLPVPEMELAGPVATAAERVVLSFIIPVRNDAKGLQRCLASVDRSAKGAATEVIVADNGSTDRSAEVARAAGALVLELPGYRVGEVRNRAARRARGDFLAFVDADHEIALDWVPAALRTMDDVTIAATGDLCHAPAGGPWVQQMYDKLRSRGTGTRAVDWLGSGNLVVRRTAFEAVGGFDTTLETCEDVDLCQRLIARGGRIVAVDAMVNVHYGDPQSLKALFLGELWRGRDNLRVSLRVPLKPRSLPSIAIPIFTLAGLGLSTVGVVAWPWGGAQVASLGLAVMLALAAPPAALIVIRTPRAELGLMQVVRALLFSGVYNLARALALVVRAGHRLRRTA